MTIRDLVRTDIVTASSDQSAGNLATLMAEENVGSVVIVKERRPVGIVTDRDLTVKVLKERADPREVTASDVMTPGPVTAGMDDGVFAVIRAMRDAPARRMPVVADDGTIAGIITLDDLLVLLADELQGLATVARRNRRRTDPPRRDRSRRPDPRLAIPVTADPGLRGTPPAC